MDNRTQARAAVAVRGTNHKPIYVMLSIFGGSLIGGAVLLTAFFELTKL